MTNAKELPGLGEMDAAEHVIDETALLPAIDFRLFLVELGRDGSGMAPVVTA